MERGLSNELLDLIRFLNDRYATEAFNQIDFEEVRRIAGTCVTGCAIAKPGPVGHAPSYEGFMPRLSSLAAGA
jgi:hypothetical protein